MLLLAGCGSGAGRAPEAQALVEAAFAAAHEPGPVGTEVLGKGVWFSAPALNSGCLQKKGWGVRDLGKSGGHRISPRFSSQRFWTHATPGGYCIYLGNDLHADVQNVNKLGDAWIVEVKYSMGREDGWWDCVDERQVLHPVRVVEGEGGALRIDGDATLYQGDCPAPLPVGDLDRKGGPWPSKPAPRAPSKAEALAAIKALDDALFAQDYIVALDAVSCVNLLEESSRKYGACAPSELIGLGPIPRGKPRRQDGPPWNDQVFDSVDVDELGPIVRDRKDKTLAHVEVREKKGKHKHRTLALQWVDRSWKVLGVVSAAGEGLTNLRFVYDLDRPEKRDIFERRLKGEKIDENGAPLDTAEPEE